MIPQPDSSQPERSLAVVTGAAHRLGRAIALELARKGFAIGLHYHASQAQAEVTAAELRALGAPVILLRADLRDPAQIARMAGEIETAPYPLRVWVNSAAVMPRANLRDISPDDWDATLALNLRAPLLCAQAAARLMGEAGGLIVNVSDVGAQKAWTGFPAYTVSKSALETLTRLLAKTLAPRVRVNAVAPGLVLPAADLPPEEWQRLVQRLPMKRPAEVEEVARVVGFFIDNPYVTGQILAVDGGYQLI